MEMYHFVFILIAAVNGSPADTRCRPNVGLTLVHRLRRWPNVNPTLFVMGSLRDREVACSASDRQGSSFEFCVWRTVSSQSSHHPQEVLLAQFSLYVHKGGLKPDSFHFHFVVLRARTLRTITTVYSRPVGVGFLVSVSVADSRTWGRLGVGWGAGQGPGWVRGGPGRGGGCRHCGRHTATSVAVPRGIFPRRTPACDHFGTILRLTETLIRKRNNFLFNDFPPIVDAKQDFKIYILFDHGMFKLVYKHEF